MSRNSSFSFCYVVSLPNFKSINFSFSSSHTSSVEKSSPDTSTVGTRGLASTEQVELDVEVVESETDKTSGLNLVCGPLLHCWFAK